MQHADCGEFGSLIDRGLKVRDRDDGSWHSMIRPHLARSTRKGYLVIDVHQR